MKLKLKDKVCILTGATSGIGWATCKLFASEGAVVAAFGRSVEKGKALENLLRAAGSTCRYHRVDVSLESEVTAAVEAVEREFGRIDVLVNNAGVRARVPILQMDAETWDRIYAVNVRGIFLTCRAAVPVMKRLGGGVVVNTASELGLIGHVGFGCYASSKAAAISLTKTMAIEFAPDVRVNAVLPGPIDTPMLWDDRPDTPQGRQGLGQRQPLGRIGRPEEIARAILFLAGDDSSYVTGAHLVVDGGGICGVMDSVPITGRFQV